MASNNTYTTYFNAQLFYFFWGGEGKAVLMVEWEVLSFIWF